MKRLAIVVALFLTVYAGWRFGVLYFDVRPEQDKCAVGEVSIQNFSALLAEARRRSISVWPRLAGTELDVAENLRLRIRDLNTGRDSLSARIAGVHAVMRSSGAFLHGMTDYSNISLRITDNPENPLEGVSGLVFPYFVDSLNVGHFDLLDRYARITITLPLVIRSYDRNLTSVKRPIEFDEFYAIVSFPNSAGRLLRLGKGWVGYDAEAHGPPCPSMPPPDWVSVYEQWKVVHNIRNTK